MLRRVTPALFRKIGLLVLLLSMASPAFATERLLVRRNALEAYLLVCGPVTTIEIRAPSPEYFSTNIADLNYLARKLNLVLGVNAGCSQVETIVLTGRVSNRLYFAGAAKRVDNWRLRGLYASP